MNQQVALSVLRLIGIVTAFVGVILTVFALVDVLAIRIGENLSGIDIPGLSVEFMVYNLIQNLAVVVLGAVFYKKSPDMARAVAAPA